MVDQAVEEPFGDGLWLTAMLLSTLVPTFLHLVVVLASPLAVLWTPTERRLALAAALDGYADADDERKKSIEWQAGKWAGRRQPIVLATAVALAVILVAVVGVGISQMLSGFGHPGGLPGLVAWFAEEGIAFAQWLGPA